MPKEKFTVNLIPSVETNSSFKLRRTLAGIIVRECGTTVAREIAIESLSKYGVISRGLLDFCIEEGLITGLENYIRLD